VSVEEVDARIERTWATAISAAREILATDGWDAVTHVRVAQKTGISRTTLYRHWPDSASLLLAAVSSAAAVAHASSAGDLCTDLQAELRVINERFTDPEGARVAAAVIDRAEWDEEIRAAKAQLVEAQLTPLIALLQHGCENGELRKDLDVSAAASKLVGPLMFRRFFSGESNSAEFIEQLVQDFLTVAKSGSRR
jgi:AcrR family transcriptional regulator